MKSKVIEKGARGGLDAIDSVHGIEGLPPLDITAITGNSNGKYKWYEDGKPVGIGINSKGDHQEMTTAHEIGHFIDHQALGQAGSFASEDKNSEAGQIVAALRNTESYKNVGVIETTMPNGITYEARMSRSDVAYYRKPIEVFARAYSQYIAVRSQNPEMLRHLEESRNKGYKILWTDEEFEPIAKQFDAMFEGKGLRK